MTMYTRGINSYHEYNLRIKKRFCINYLSVYRKSYVIQEYGRISKKHL
jgi:hypothetical protein